MPARLDRLPWSRWHVRLVIALGITWLLDGLEVTLVGSLSGVLGEPSTLHLADSQIGLAASAYLLGAISGALLFGRLTDSLGRKRLFLVTLAVYSVATVCTALSWGFASFAFFRLVTGAGIGGEYAAINSAIDELVPARVRGHTDLAINSTYWAGTALGSASTLVLLDPSILPHSVGWRVCFGLGALLGAAVLLVRRHVPESPRWLLLHGRAARAEAIAAEIEADVARTEGALPPPPPPRQLRVQGTVGLRHVARVLLRQHLRRTVLGLALMIAQAFAYNAIFFTYALVLGRFYGVPSDRVGLYLLPFAAGNLLGPFVLGRLFDTVGRRRMIALTYGTSGLLLVATGWAFARGCRCRRRPRSRSTPRRSRRGPERRTASPRADGSPPGRSRSADPRSRSPAHPSRPDRRGDRCPTGTRSRRRRRGPPTPTPPRSGAACRRRRSTPAPGTSRRSSRGARRGRGDRRCTPPTSARPRRPGALPSGPSWPPARTGPRARRPRTRRR